MYLRKMKLEYLWNYITVLFKLYFWLFRALLSIPKTEDYLSDLAAATPITLLQYNTNKNLDGAAYNTNRPKAPHNAHG